MKNFQGNYIKRISFYAGLIAFFVALGFSIFTYFRDTLKEGESLIENAKSSLAPYIKWYQEDSSKELERYRNLSKAEFEKLDVDLIIEKNLQDIKNIFEDVDILTRFDFLDDEDKLKQVAYLSVNAMSMKMYLFSALLDKEREFNPTDTYFILNNSKRYQNFLSFQNFLKNKIEKNFLHSTDRQKNSLERMGYYYFMMNTYYFSILTLILEDIQVNTCKVDKTIVQNSLSQYRFIQESTKALFETLDKKINHFSTNDEKKEVLQGYKKFYQDFITSINKEQSTIQAIQSNLKKCK